MLIGESRREENVDRREENIDRREWKKGEC